MFQKIDEKRRKFSQAIVVLARVGTERTLRHFLKVKELLQDGPLAVESAWRGKEKAVVSTRTNSPKAAVNLLFIVLPVYLKSSTRIFHDATARIFHKGFLSALMQPGSVILFLPPSPSNMLRSLAVCGGSFDSGQSWAR